MPWIAKRDPGQRGHHSYLRNDDPSAPSPQEAAEDGRIVAVEKGRPQEFELVSEGGSLIRPIVAIGTFAS